MTMIFRWLMVLLTVSSTAYASDLIPDAQERNYQPVRFDNYEVHYSAFKSTFVSPEIAKQYDLKRDDNYGVINIAVRDIKNSETGKAVTGDIKGQHKNLMTQVKRLEFKEVKEGGAVYYLADFKFSDEELLRFTVDVKPSTSQRAETVRFEQTFYEK